MRSDTRESLEVQEPGLRWIRIMGETRVGRAQEQTEGSPCLLKVMFGDLEI